MNDEQLNQVLHEWKADVRMPVRFRANVWERIAARQEARPQPLTARIQQWLIGLMLRPAQVTALAVLMLTLGMSAGWWKGNADRAEAWDDLKVRYVTSIDPYAQARTPAER